MAHRAFIPCMLAILAAGAVDASPFFTRRDANVEMGLDIAADSAEAQSHAWSARFALLRSASGWSARAEVSTGANDQMLPRHAALFALHCDLGAGWALAASTRRSLEGLDDRLVAGATIERSLGPWRFAYTFHRAQAAASDADVEHQLQLEHHYGSRSMLGVRYANGVAGEAAAGEPRVVHTLSLVVSQRVSRGAAITFDLGAARLGARDAVPTLTLGFRQEFF